VRFPDEIVFEESIKEADGEAIMGMLRRVSLCIDVNRINMAGMTALHQAVLDDRLVLVRSPATTRSTDRQDRHRLMDTSTCSSS